MSLDLWSQILDCCKREGHFVDWAHFFGEPLSWKFFFDGMALWRDSGLSKFGHISTNGHLLTDEHIDCIADSGIEYIRICVDTLRPEVYKKFRGSVDYCGLLEKTERFLRRAPKVHCQIQLLRSAINADESPRDMFKRFGRFRNLSVFVSDLLDIGGDPLLNIRSVSSPDPRTCTKLNYEHCPIAWDGEIGLCCPDYALQNRLGNISEGSITNVYLGARAEVIREKVRNGDYSLSPYCSRCAMGHVGSKSEDIDPSSLFASVKALKYIRTRFASMIGRMR